MAPVTAEHHEVEEQVKNVIQDLFQVMVQVSNYDSAGRPSKEALAENIQTLDESMRKVHRSASTLPLLPGGGPGIPSPLIEYVENGRNPDIYTREFVELVRRLNQVTRGKMHAFRDFRDVLAHEMDLAMPELREDVARVVEETGGGGDASSSQAQPPPPPPGAGGTQQQQQQTQTPQWQQQLSGQQQIQQAGGSGQ